MYFIQTKNNIFLRFMNSQVLKLNKSYLETTWSLVRECVLKILLFYDMNGMFIVLSETNRKVYLSPTHYMKWNL